MEREKGKEVGGGLCLSGGKKECKLSVCNWINLANWIVNIIRLFQSLKIHAWFIGGNKKKIKKAIHGVLPWIQMCAKGKHLNAWLGFPYLLTRSGSTLLASKIMAWHCLKQPPRAAYCPSLSCQASPWVCYLICYFISGHHYPKASCHMTPNGTCKLRKAWHINKHMNGWWGKGYKKRKKEREKKAENAVWPVFYQMTKNPSKVSHFRTIQNPLITFM